ncbi:MAG: hypothetical protein K6T86_17410 [Pirellulales bacterium]|nr:hypothetical protein [Pirellulales bacterium]
MAELEAGIIPPQLQAAACTHQGTGCCPHLLLWSNQRAESSDGSYLTGAAGR